MDLMKEQLVQLLFKLRNLGSFATSRMDACPVDVDINMTEFLFMQQVADRDVDHCFSLSDMQKRFGITKSGASKMLAALEKKGCLLRDTDKKDRRNLVVTLTSAGRDAVAQLRGYVDAALSEYIRRLGESDLKQAISLISRLEKESNAVRELVRTKSMRRAKQGI